MSKIFEEMENPTTEKTNSSLNVLMDNIADAVSDRNFVDKVFKNMAWNEEYDWSDVTYHLQLVRSFSFVETHTEIEKGPIPGEVGNSGGRAGYDAGASNMTTVAATKRTSNIPRPVTSEGETAMMQKAI
jgi:hypothetical protein